MDRVRVINRRRTTLKKQVTQLANNVASGQFNKLILKSRLARVTDMLTAYEELNDELALIDPDNDRLDEILGIQDQYYICAGTIEGMEDAGTSVARQNETLGNTGLNSTLAETRRTMKLPVTELPKFDGSLDKWLSFRNTFVTMVNARTDITDLERFIYLKNSLRGEALSKIIMLDASEENYQSAWQLLVESYDKRRLLISRHVNAILDMESLTKATTSGLTKLVDVVRQHLSMLKTLEIIPDPTMVICVLEKLLPNDLRQKWEESLDENVFPSLEKFYKFVSTASNSLRHLEEASGRGREKIESQSGNKRRSDREPRAAKTRKIEASARTLVTATTKSCFCCKQNHSIYKCPTFQKMTTSQRWDVVKRKQLCRNCLRPHAGECKGPRCKLCGRFHNALLHGFANQQSSAGPSTSQAKPENETTDQTKSS
ncbi:uncharacterized protein LOC123988912 [Osmia bicornis bicornis]|uniref:uncharacterized protein LOC123988912 n=1 Tax=Osmia bicornis bicornis TaxID=1437191 RepID=UPI001EAF2945|nr:uncharacterized protein LOC123988912 [Osmia bicornis bicornis]